MALPSFLQPYLPSYDLSRLEIEGDKRLIITEVLNKGDFRALSWIGKTYSKEEIHRVITTPMRGMWHRSVLMYWLRIFDLSLPEETMRDALLNLKP